MEPIYGFERKRRVRRDRGASQKPPAGGAAAELPSPETVFLAWSLWLPDGADIAAAAQREITRIERKAPLCPDLMRLHALFLETAAANER